jgi:hypothetical protein
MEMVVLRVLMNYEWLWNRKWLTLICFGVLAQDFLRKWEKM